MARARNKHYIRVLGKHEIDRFADRRPEMYTVLTQPHGLKNPAAGKRARSMSPVERGLAAARRRMDRL